MDAKWHATAQGHVNITAACEEEESLWRREIDLRRAQAKREEQNEMVGRLGMGWGGTDARPIHCGNKYRKPGASSPETGLEAPGFSKSPRNRARGAGLLRSPQKYVFGI